MQNKSKTRTDVQWVISSISLAATVGLWSLFTASEKKGAGVVSQVALAPTPEQVVVSQPQTLLPGQVLLLAGTTASPQAQPTTVITRTRRGGGGGGGGGSKPSGHTGSSKP